MYLVKVAYSALAQIYRPWMGHGSGCRSDQYMGQVFIVVAKNKERPNGPIFFGGATTALAALATAFLVGMVDGSDQ